MQENNRTIVKDYYNLYLSSQEKIRQEELISESLLYSIIRELKHNGSSFIAEFVGYYHRPDTRSSWKKHFFDKMNEIFFNGVNWEFSSVSSVGWDNYSYMIYFTMNGNKYNLMIPAPGNITIDNIKSANFGRYSFSKDTNGTVWETVCSSYSLKEIAVAIKKESGCKIGTY